MKETDAVGTVRLNHKHMPMDLKNKIPCGEAVARFTNNMMVQKWIDRKEVTVLLTFHSNEMKTVKTHRGDKHKPAAVLTNNKNMGAVDMADQMLVAYPTECKRHSVV